VLDTRTQYGGKGAFIGQQTVNVAGSVCAPPGSAQAYVFNATVVPIGSLPYALAFFPLMVLTGLWMWKGYVVRRLISKKSAWQNQGSERTL